MSLSRVQRKTLSHMRQLIRHVQTRVRSADPHGAAVWRKHIVQQYRANQSVSSKAEARQLRRAAADKLALLQAVDEEQTLFRMYSGIDTDSSQYIKASAHRVGLEMPARK